VSGTVPATGPQQEPEPGPGAGPEDGPFADLAAPRPVLAREIVHHGLIWDVFRDTVDLGPGGTVRREYVRHPGAVCVLALDDADRVLMIRQYRHPVRSELWELPAGLLDVPGEPPWRAAGRELAEETDLRAGSWAVLVDWFNSPGGLDEVLRCYLARDLTPVPEAERHVREAEEVGMPIRWVPLDEARDAVLAGAVHNPGAVVGVLAAWAARQRDWAELRPVDAPWPQREDRRAPGPD
jgi:8-oxo-dGDP phosphatase